ncbi:MAG: tRNA (adenosine(37)-N6)-threonylcarbamoyltransferase complex dimerization subunit type 1 TsaB [Hellea sp.]
MRILGLDTTGAYCSAAIVDTAKVLAHKSENIGRGHAERLAPMVAELLAGAGLTAKDIDKIAVCTGPGSFTGLRVALAFAKGFALPRKLPVVGIDALQVTAEDMAYTDGDEAMIIYRDIRRNEVMSATYEGALRIGSLTTSPLDDIIDEANEFGIAFVESLVIDTRILAWLGADLSPEKHPAQPLYSRGPDAKLPGGIEPPK